MLAGSSFSAGVCWYSKISLLIKPACAVLYLVMSHENSMPFTCAWKKKTGILGFLDKNFLVKPYTVNLQLSITLEIVHIRSLEQVMQMVHNHILILWHVKYCYM